MAQMMQINPMTGCGLDFSSSKGCRPSTANITITLIKVNTTVTVIQTEIKIKKNVINRKDHSAVELSGRNKISLADLNDSMPTFKIKMSRLFLSIDNE